MIWTIIPIVSVVGGAMYYGNNYIDISRYNIASSKIPQAFNGFKILQLSDLHSKRFGKENRRLLEAIEREKPDVIVMTGDMVDSSEREFGIFLDLVRNLIRYKIYFVEGNNETKLPEESNKELMKAMKEAGVNILNNSKMKLTRDGKHINLYGILYELRYYKEVHSGYSRKTYFSESNMTKSVGKCSNEEFNILLAHNPLYFESYAKWGADLTLSGHVHGGLIRVPGVGGLLSPERKFFPKYSEGQYEIVGKKLIVNRGLGGKIIIPRVFNKPEISVVTLNHE